ncbi:TRAP transporter large permease subunit [Hwanghaeella sp. 1Z406]|jgi:tripartite ATP-independent transporter DctM subunit|uniref:TRAP transporter large permease n=1 Tax=Hwanghaeella sp. 1Z406 TaxID=3402811 RepID=UPI003B66CBF5
MPLVDDALSGYTKERDANSGQSATGLRLAAQRILGFFDSVIGGAATLALIALILIVLANVIGRYGFNNSLTWGGEAAQWLFIGVIFLAVPLAHRGRAHLSIQFLVERLPVPLQTAAGFLSDLIIAYATVMLLLGGMTLIDAVGGVNYALNLPSWVKFALIPVTSALGLLYLALQGLDEGKRPWRGIISIALAFGLYFLLQPGGLVSLKGLDPGTTMIVSFLVAMAIGTPVAFAMIFAAFAANAAGAVMPPAAVVQTMVNGSSKFLLLAIPFFIAAGALMNVGGLTSRLMDFAFKLVGHLRGGFAQVNIVSSGFYAGISGSSYSEAALGTKLLVPQMVKHGYSPGFSCAVTAAAATLPNVIPPSIALLILASVANLSVGSLWLAGVVPGLLMGASLMLCIYVIARMRGYGTANQAASWSDRGRAGIKALPVLGLAIVIIGGIRGGVVTPTEAGVLAVAYAFVLGIAVYRTFTWRELWQTLRGAAVEAAMVGLLIGAAAPFTFVLVTEQIPQSLSALITGLSDNPYIVLLLANVLMLFFGMFLDIGAAILILTPLLMPVMVSMGVDPIHFGLIVVVNLMLGGLTPPVGMLVFISSAISKTPVHDVFRAMYPLLGALLIALVIITYVPAVSLGLGWLLQGN